MYYFKMILACLLLPAGLYAQHITVRDENGIIVNNDTLLRVVGGPVSKPPYTEMQCYLYAENTSAMPMDMGARKTEITLSANAEHTFCFAGICYDSSVFISPNGSMTAPGGIASTFYGHYRFIEATHTPAIDLVAYTFYDRNNPLDSAVVYVIYNTTTITGIQSAGYTKPHLIVAPDPANDIINFDCSKVDGEPANLIIVDAIGRIMMKRAINNINKTLSLPTDQWPASAYHYILYSKDNSTAKGTFVIAH